MADIEDLCGRVLGAFVLRERIDQGGFGTVYRADQPALGRPVVVKVLRRRARRQDVSVQRFAREALLSCQLDHPYAAHVYTFGVEDDGLVWIAMELVQGVTLSRWLTERARMPIEQFVPIFEKLAEVVHAAHQRGIIHRDLKPSNVMLIERAGKVLPKLLDFGVARLLDGVTLPHLAETEALVMTDETPRELAAVSGSDMISTVRLPLPAGRGGRVHRLTRASAVVGSPPYMAPEQWEGTLEVAPALDLYALGVLAYEALTGRLPFRAERAIDYAVLHRNAPVPPLGDGLEAFDDTLRQALAKNPQDRFRSALDFASALRSDLEARLVAQVRSSARLWDDRGRPRGMLWRDDALAELTEWMARTGAGLLTQLELEFAEASQAQEAELQESRQRRAAWARRGAIAAATALVIAIVCALQYRARVQTREAEHQARLVKDFADLGVRQSHVEQGRAALLHGELEAARRHLTEAVDRGDHSPGTEFMLDRVLQASSERARFNASTGRMWSSRFSPSGRQIVTSDDGHAQIWDVKTKAPIATLPHAGTVYNALYNAAGSRIYTASADGTVRIWNAADGTALKTLASHQDGTTERYVLLALSRNEDLLAAINVAGTRVWIWSLPGGAPVATLHVSGTGFPSLAFGSNAQWLVVGGGDGVSVFSTSSWRPVTTMLGPNIHTMAVHPERDWIATATVDGDVSIWDATTGKRVHHLRELGDPVDRVAYSPDGSLLAIANRDGTEQIWRATTGTLRSTGVRLQGSTLTLEFDPTSRFVLAAGGTGTVVVADVDLGMPSATLEGAGGAIYSAHFDPTSTYIVGASWDGTARLWSARSPHRVWAAPPVTEDCGLFGGVDPDDRYVAVGCRGLPTRVWDTSSNHLLAELPAITRVDGDYSSAYPAVNANGTRAAIARGNAVELYDLPSGHRLRAVKHAAQVNAVAFGPGDLVVSGDIGGDLLVTREGREPLLLPRTPGGVDAVGVLPDGRVLAADARRRLRVYSYDGAAILADVPLEARARALRVSSDGQRLATLPRPAAQPAVPELWDLEHYRLLAPLAGHVGGVFSVRFQTDIVLTAGADSSVRMWDIRTGNLMQTYQDGSRTMTDATLDPTGQFVVAGGGDGVLRFWDKSGSLIWQQVAHRSPIAGIHYQGQDLISRGFGGDISRWRLVPAPRLLDERETQEHGSSD